MEEFDGNNPAEALISLKESGKKTPVKGSSLIDLATAKEISDALNDDDSYHEDDWSSPSSPQSYTPKKAKGSPIKGFAWGSVFTFAEKRTMKALSNNLNNLLKQPKARRWVCYEWFYSEIDRALFLGENDFSQCLKDYFPNLRTRNLTRTQWSMIRRMMGKPRRCSAAFLAEERQALMAKRRKIRYLMQRKSTDASDFNTFKDLPEEIALPIVIGTKVTARLHHPQDGLFSGQVDAVDNRDNTYRITFDQQALGTCTVQDIDVASNEGHETIPISSLIAKDRSSVEMNILSPAKESGTEPLNPDHYKVRLTLNYTGGEPAFSASLPRTRLEQALKNVESGGSYGGFPIKFLVLATRLSRILAVKKKCVRSLKEMNGMAEKMESHGEAFTHEFQRKYSGIVLELDRINEDLNTCLQGVQQYCLEVKTKEENDENLTTPLGQFKTMQSKCDNEAQLMVEKSEKKVRSNHIRSLVTDLTSILLQFKFFSDNNLKPFELASINQATERIRSKIDPRNVGPFADKVEVHLAHIQNGLAQAGNVHAFSNNIAKLANG